VQQQRRWSAWQPSSPQGHLAPLSIQARMTEAGRERMHRKSARCRWLRALRPALRRCDVNGREQGLRRFGKRGGGADRGGFRQLCVVAAGEEERTDCGNDGDQNDGADDQKTRSLVHRTCACFEGSGLERGCSESASKLREAQRLFSKSRRGNSFEETALLQGIVQSERLPNGPLSSFVVARHSDSDLASDLGLWRAPLNGRRHSPAGT
jgi:hypothetical protein